MTIEELKTWVCENGYHKEKGTFSPGMAKRVEKNISIKEAILEYSPPDIVIGAKTETSPYICERILYIMGGILSQKKCSCGISIHIKRDACSTKCASNSSTTNNKRKTTNLERYGFECSAKSQEVKNKISFSNKLLSSDAKVKRKETNIERYGVEHLLQSEEHKLKAITTTQERFGVNNIFQDKNFIETNKEYRKQNPSDTSRQQERKFKTCFLSKTAYHIENTIPLFTENDWHLKLTDMKYLCGICNTEFYRYSSYVRRCTNCFPVDKSVIESEIFNYVNGVSNVPVIHTDRTTIRPFELDIHIPHNHVAIEYDSLYYHSYGPDQWSKMSNEDTENKIYHLTKTELCLEKNIQLLHIFEHEWTNPIKQNIWKSMINSKLGMAFPVGARKCKIVIPSVKEERDFLTLNHIQGYYTSQFSYGLEYENELIGLLTIGKSRYNKNYDWEILRYCNKIGFSISGGFSKLLSHFRTDNVGSIITYADRRYSNGNLYRDNGFEELKNSQPKYLYTKPKKGIVASRQQYQKHMLKDKLEIFDANLSEVQNMFNNGWRRMWDCGNKVFALKDLTK